jgi:hypothetical protein
LRLRLDDILRARPENGEKKSSIHLDSRNGGFELRTIGACAARSKIKI